MYNPCWIRLRAYNGLSFQYRKLENGDRQIEYGSLPFRGTITSDIFQEMLQHFRGKTVLLGASYNDIPPESLGAWLTSKQPGCNLALYVGSILIHEECAKWKTTQDGISLRFPS
jgi:hypothetical protein